MKKVFNPIPCGETLPIKNIHAVSVSMPKLSDVIGYEEHDEEITKKIKSAYPRFILHPYLKILAEFIQKKYSIPLEYEIVLLSSSKAVKIVSDRYFIHNRLSDIEIREPFGIILVKKGTCQLQRVLTFIQHVGCNLSSRFAEDYLIKEGVLKDRHVEELEDREKAYDIVLDTLSKGYEQPKENICLAPSGMNAVYSVIRGLRSIQRRNGRDILVQFGWLYLDTMNIVKHHYDRNKIFYDIRDLDALEEYLKKDGLKVSAIITEVPTNPLLLTVDVKRLSKLCKEYNIPLVIDSTFATPYNLELKPYADIYIESLTKFACGNADVLMGCFILNENSKISHMTGEFFKHADRPYIKDIQRLAFEIQNYKSRMKKINQNALELVNYFKGCEYIDKIFHTSLEPNVNNYKAILKDESGYGGIVSISFKVDFQKAYDMLNFPKGPSLGTEFTLLMPYVYLAHYDYVTSESGREFLKNNGIPIDLIRISVGVEEFSDIKAEFERLKEIL